jgi:hypothetical protein
MRMIRQTDLSTAVNVFRFEDRGRGIDYWLDYPGAYPSIEADACFLPRTERIIHKFHRGIKQEQREAYYSRPSSSEVKNTQRSTFIHQRCLTDN